MKLIIALSFVGIAVLFTFQAKSQPPKYVVRMDNCSDLQHLIPYESRGFSAISSDGIRNHWNLHRDRGLQYSRSRISEHELAVDIPVEISKVRIANGSYLDLLRIRGIIPRNNRLEISAVGLKKHLVYHYRNPSEFAYGRPDGKVFYLYSGQEAGIASEQAHRDTVVTLSWLRADPERHSWENRFISSGADSTLILWQTSRGHTTYHVTKVTELAYTDIVKRIWVSPSNTEALLLGRNGKVKRWHLYSNRLVDIGDSRAFTTATYAPDGQTVLTGDATGRMELWDTLGKRVKVISDAVAYQRKGEVNAPIPIYSPVTESTPSGQITPRVPHKPSHKICSIVYCKNGRYALVGYTVGYVKLWDIQAKKAIATFYSFVDQDEWLITTPEGTFDGSQTGLKNLFYLQSGAVSSLSDSLFRMYRDSSLGPTIMSYFQTASHTDTIPDTLSLVQTKGDLLASYLAGALSNKKGIRSDQANQPHMSIEYRSIRSGYSYTEGNNHSISRIENELIIRNKSGLTLSKIPIESSRLKSYGLFPKSKIIYLIKYVYTRERGVCRISFMDFSGRILKEILSFEDIVKIEFSPDEKHFVIFGGKFLKCFTIDGKCLWMKGGKEAVAENQFSGTPIFAPNSQSVYMNGNGYLSRFYLDGRRDLATTDLEHPNYFLIPKTGAYILLGTQKKIVILDSTFKPAISIISKHDSLDLDPRLTDFTHVSLSPNGQHLLLNKNTPYIPNGRSYELWKTDALGWRQQVDFDFKPPAGELGTISITENGKEIMMTGKKGVYIYNLNGTYLRTVKQPALAAAVLASTTNGDRLATRRPEGVQIWDMQRANIQSTIATPGIFMKNGFDLSRGGDSMLLSGRDRIFFIEKNRVPIQTFKHGSERAPDHVRYSFLLPNDRILGLLWGKAFVWSMNGALIKEFNVNQLDHIPAYLRKENTELAAISNNRKKFLIHNSGRIRFALFDLSGNELAAEKARFSHTELNLSGNPVTAMAFSHDDNYFFIGDSEGAIFVYDLQGEYVTGIRASMNSSVDVITPSKDGKYLLTASRDETHASIWKLDSLSTHAKAFTLLHTLEAGVSNASFTQEGKGIITADRAGSISFWLIETGARIATLYYLSHDRSDFIITTPEGYYRASREALENISFSFGEEAYFFDQFDLRFNRPDKVLEALLPLGSDSTLINPYFMAYQKRLEKYGFNEDMLADDFHTPVCNIQNVEEIPTLTTDSQVSITISASDSISMLNRLNIYVNDVPVFGIKGIGLAHLQQHTWDTTLYIPLSHQTNKIEVSVMNQGGIESRKSATTITYDSPIPKSDLYILTIGVSDYEAEGMDLQFAAKDAKDVHSHYQSSRTFTQVHSRILINENATKKNIIDAKRWLQNSRINDQVLIFVSGHGLRDGNHNFYYATHDIDFSNPSEKGILYEEIESLLDGIPARKKILLIDACNSGEYDNELTIMSKKQIKGLKKRGIFFKGFSPTKNKGRIILSLINSFELMQQLFADLRQGSGTTIISSSSGGQVSYENAEWANGAFTYAFLNGLKSMEADANKDGQVTASEIQKYMVDFVPKLTDGLQVPTFRRENLEYDFRVW